jgi:L-rhamnose isomerase/sugar isomerase
VIRIGNELGSKSITVWLADGHNFPGQRNFRKVYRNTVDSLREIYSTLPSGWRLFLEYKPYEPQFYSTVIQDWGTSYLMVSELGPQAFCLVDLGHHLPNTNIEQIVSTLLMKNKLGGFHFNDSKYGDDDLTAGSIKPYQLFLIFQELRDGIEQDVPLAWMIDASHNVKDPLEDLMQSVEALKLAYVQAMLVDKEALEYAQENNDPVIAQEIIQGAFRTDVRPLLAESRRRLNGAINPVHCFRDLQVRQQLVKERGKKTIATGL